MGYLKIDVKRETKKLVNFIKQKIKDLDRDGLILGLSGGIDSAVVACLSTKATKNVLALIMPEKYSNKENIKDAIKIAKKLKIRYKLINLTSTLKKLGAYKTPLRFFPTQKLKSCLIKKVFQQLTDKYKENPFSLSLVSSKDKLLARGNASYRIKHRLRMLLLYYYGELNNYLVAGCANKTEYLIGFFVKHGIDSATDIMPIIHLYKTQVKELAHYLGIENRIINKAPSPDLIPGIIDEYAIGLEYKKLDLILWAIEHNNKKILNQFKKETAYVKNLIKNSEHMRHVYTLK